MVRRRGAEKLAVRVADETFIAAALLHREHPERTDFTIREIVERAERENVAGVLRPGVQWHASLHCVANKPPNPERIRMLYATKDGRRRLLQQGDEIHPERTGKIFPDPEDVPSKYHELIEWAKQRFANGNAPAKAWLSDVFQLFGLGQDTWRGEDPDEYVRRLRENWE